MKRLARPIPAEGHVPHRKPMRLVDDLLGYDETAGQVSAYIDTDCPMLTDAGHLEPVALVELLAQAYAAFKGYCDHLDGLPPRKGFLVGVKQVEIFGCPVIGDTLTVDIRESAVLDPFVLVEGQVLRAAEKLADGVIKLYIPAQPAPEEKD